MSTGQRVGHNSEVDLSGRGWTASGGTDFYTSATRASWFYYADDHGIKPDGTDIYAPMQALITKVNAAGGGKIVFRRGTYSCLTRRSAANGALKFQFRDLPNGLVIEGNGAKIDMNGSYVRAATTDNTMSFEFIDVNGLVIRDLEVDGNNQDTTFGAGESPDHGIQIVGCVDVELTRVWSHHHPMDGFLIRDSKNFDPYVISKRVQMTGCVADYNGRQGASLTGVRHLTAIGCNFSNTGKSSYGVHAPGGGIDIEPDSYPGLDAASGGLVNDADDYSGDIHFIGCRFENNRSEVAIAPAWDDTYGIPAGTYYPITFTGCDFVGEVGADPRLGISGRDVRFLHCRFKDVQFLPNYSWGEWNNDHTWVEACEFDNSDPDQFVVGWSRNGAGSLASDPPSLSIRNSKFRLDAPSVATPNPVRLYINALSTTLTKGEFVNNKIWVSGAEHDGTADDDLAQLSGFVTHDNEWITTLDITGSKFWNIGYGTGGQTFNERFLTASAFSPTGSVFTDSVFSRNSLVTGMLEVGDGTWTGSAKRKIVMRTAAPVSGAWLRGDLALNSNPANSDAVAGWKCTTSGSPGTWVTLAPLGMVQAAARASVGALTADPAALADAATQADLETLRTAFDDLLSKLRTAKLLAP